MPKVNRHPARYRAYRMGRTATNRKGMPGRRIIAAVFIRPNNEYTLHATKGYRYRRLAPSRNALLEALMQRIT
jgi:hypothetical protein